MANNKTPDKEPKEVLHAEKLPKDWDLLPGEKATPFTLPETPHSKRGAEEEVQPVPSINAAPVVVDRAELEKRLGGNFEDVTNEAGRRSNERWETYSDGYNCFVYQCPRGAKPPIVAHTWADVADTMRL